MGIFKTSNGASLEKVLVNADECSVISRRDINNHFSIAPHHDQDTLDRLDEQILLAAGLVVRAKDTCFHAVRNLAREDTTKGVESTSIRNHL